MGAEPAREGPGGPRLADARNRVRSGGVADLGGPEALSRSSPCGLGGASSSPDPRSEFQKQAREQDVNCFSPAVTEALPPLPAAVGMRSWLLSFIAAVEERVSSCECVRRKVGSVCRQAGLILF